MDIVIIGAGAVASVFIKLLIRDTSVRRIRCITNDLRSARHFITAHSKKLTILRGDAGNARSLAVLCQGASLIVNASLPRFNEAVMQTALAVHAHYQDFASELADWKTAEQLKYDAAFKKARLTALINTGVAPGVTNLLAREGADLLDRVDSIKFRILEDQPSSEPVFAWSLETTIDELTADPLVFRNRKLGFTKPFADAELFTFPGSIGPRTVYSIYGDEVATIPKYIHVKHVDFKSTGTDIEFARVLHMLGLFSTTPIKVDGRSIIPLHFLAKVAPRVPTPQAMLRLIKEGAVTNAHFALVVEVTGTSAKKPMSIRMSAQFPDLKQITKLMPGATYISYPTATAAYAFTVVLPRIHAHGVLPPEALPKMTRKQIILELNRHDIRITTDFKRKKK